MGRDDAGPRTQHNRARAAASGCSAAASRSPIPPATPSTTSRSCTIGTAFAGDVGGVRIPPSVDRAPADAAARHRRRGVARVDRAAALVAAAAAGGHALRRQRRRSTTSSTSSTRGSTRGRSWRATAATTRSSQPSTACDLRVTRAASRSLRYEQAAPVEQLYEGYERYWSKRKSSRFVARSRGRGRQRYAGGDVADSGGASARP